MTRYPLAWPEGWRRTPAARRTRALFGKQVVRSNEHGSWHRKEDLTIGDAVSRVLEELRRFGVREGDAIVSTNLSTRLDGLPRSGQAQPLDPGAAVYWERAGEAGTKVMAIDLYDRVEHNLAAIAATLEAMRAIERHGGALILERAFTGFAALPAPAGARPWWDVLRVSEGMRDRETVKRQYRQLAGEKHPDRLGGTHAAMAELNQALAEFERLHAGGS